MFTNGTKESNCLRENQERFVLYLYIKIAPLVFLFKIFLKKIFKFIFKYDIVKSLLKCVIFFSQIINTYTEAVQTVDPKLASGKPNTLWVEFAKFYEKAGQIEDVRNFSQSVTTLYMYFSQFLQFYCFIYVLITINFVGKNYI